MLSHRGGCWLIRGQCLGLQDDDDGLIMMNSFDLYLVMTDKNIKMSCDQCPLPGAGSGEIGIRVPSSRLLPAFKLSERDRKPGDNIWGQGILTTLQGLHSAHIHDARGMCL